MGRVDQHEVMLFREARSLALHRSFTGICHFPTPGVFALSANGERFLTRAESLPKVCICLPTATKGSRQVHLFTVRESCQLHALVSSVSPTVISSLECPNAACPTFLIPIPSLAKATTPKSSLIVITRRKREYLLPQRQGEGRKKFKKLTPLLPPFHRGSVSAAYPIRRLHILLELLFLYVLLC